MCSKALSYTVFSCTGLADAHFLIGSKKVWDTRIHVVKTLSYTFFWWSNDKWRMTITNAHFTNISGHFFANCMFIFHKNEVQTVILRCLAGLKLDWFKIYGLRCRWRPRACLANFLKITTDKWPFYYHIWPFFCQLYVFLSQNWVSDGHFEVLNESKS